MVRLISSVIGVGVETADMLVNEILSRRLRDRKAVARYAGLTGSPDESGERGGASEVWQEPAMLGCGAE
uniref:IS110 family transposase n=1 Tax=Mesorhizobium comanense TaxID=2502215 RepID=UPI001E2D981F|nr:IS110 family transposase [Mesorhizobium comanense]